MTLFDVYLQWVFAFVLFLHKRVCVCVLFAWQLHLVVVSAVTGVTVAVGRLVLQLCCVTGPLVRPPAYRRNQQCQ